jgi:hypothetical protein
MTDLQVEWTVGGGATRYLDEVAEWLARFGFPTVERYVEGEGVFEFPDHVIQVALGEGAFADLIWDTQDWKLICYPRRGIVTRVADHLAGVFTDRADELPRQVARLVRPKLLEAREVFGVQAES